MSINSPKDLYEAVRMVLRLKHYSYHTEQTYPCRHLRLVRFDQPRHLVKMGVAELRAYLSYLATERNSAAIVSLPDVNARTE
jgi:hypothetical protein